MSKLIKLTPNTQPVLGVITKKQWDKLFEEAVLIIKSKSKTNEKNVRR